MTFQKTGSFLQETDLEPKEFLALLDLAAELKAEKREHREVLRLVGKSIALVFEKNSTRTRCAFEVAAHDQGAHATYLGPDGSHFGREESVADTARVLGRMFDGIAYRGFAQETVEELAAQAGTPVWNALTDQWHPTQMLADMLTMREVAGTDLQDIAFCFVGDGRNNVARSLLVTGAMLGMDVRIAAPELLRPPPDVVELATDLAKASGARLNVTGDLHSAVSGAGFVYSDVWVSMGEDEVEWDRRVALLSNFRVTPEVMAATGQPTPRFMHCLPSVHNSQTQLGRRILDRFGLEGAEVTETVFESPTSIVFEQSENRLHTIKALLVASLAS